MNAFVAEVLDALGAPERHAALTAIQTLGEKRTRARAAVPGGKPGDAPDWENLL